jgi:hypothetical protein
MKHGRCSKLQPGKQQYIHRFLLKLGNEENLAGNRPEREKRMPASIIPGAGMS